MKYTENITQGFRYLNQNNMYKTAFLTEIVYLIYPLKKHEIKHYSIKSFLK